MNFWIFKLANQELYPDIPGRTYVFDNTHSIKLQSGDVFIYLDKRKGYEFSGFGVVDRVTKRIPNKNEAARSSKVRTVFTAHLKDVIWFIEPLSISNTTNVGKSNRSKLGIKDVNYLGWSQSMPRISPEMFDTILDLAESAQLIPSGELPMGSFEVPDNWSVVKIRSSLSGFKRIVLDRHESTCVVCGTKLLEVIEVAHISPYSTDKQNRANPANGICLCTFCHRALDKRLIAIKPNGELLVDESIDDSIAVYHFSRIDSYIREKWLVDVDCQFLEMTVKWYEESSVNQSST